MRIGKQWLDQLHFRALNKQLTKQSFKRTPVEYQKAREIGVLVDTRHPQNVDVVKKFVETQRSSNRSVKVLAYFNDKLEHPNFPYSYFSRKEVNLISKPSGQTVEQFINQPFDILFNLCQNENMMLNYIAALSKAHMRVGSFQENENANHYDLMIDMPKGKGINYFIQQAEQILENIKSDQYEASKV